MDEPYQDDSYLQLLDLEELESLQEEIEESGVDLAINYGQLPEAIRERLASLGIANMSDLINRIAYMHSELDESEGRDR